ncbi:hypothetical protein [Providencia rettgeri]|uniref:hypothetical protein n=1 Tax=Providencia rettgeri TaxID=587 RepID=UPI0034E0D2C7
MNKTFHQFWYRPFWQQALPFVVLIGLLLFVGYFTYWKSSSLQLIELENKKNNLFDNIQKEEQRIRQLPSLKQLAQQIENLKQYTVLDKRPLALFSHFNALLSQSAVTLNKLQPINQNEGVFMEVQGSFADIYHFLQKLIATPLLNIWYCSEITLTQRKNALIASITLSSTINSTAIKDENSHE